ncbi:MAG: hypothetical protein LBG05_08965, partial [Treponema sp.]|nr:hypothetical protein [Treponema sp.]
SSLRTFKKLRMRSGFLTVVDTDQSLILSPLSYTVSALKEPVFSLQEKKSILKAPISSRGESASSL